MQKMSSLVERLRDRTDRRPVYSLFDDSDDEVDKRSGPRQENFEKIFRPDAVNSPCTLLFYAYSFANSLLA